LLKGTSDARRLVGYCVGGQSTSALVRARSASFSLFSLLLLSLLVDICLIGLIGILHEFSHYVVASALAPAKFTVMTQTDPFPPILWVTGRASVSFTGKPSSVWLTLFYLAPAVVTLLPALCAGWLARGKAASAPMIGLRNGLVCAWMLEALFTLFPTFNSSVGPSDGALALGKAGIEFALTNPLAIFIASYPAWAVFRFAWWITAVYVTSRFFFKQAQLSFILIFSLASFVAIGLVMSATGIQVLGGMLSSLRLRG
jgi:hypothetical protein